MPSSVAAMASSGSARPLRRLFARYHDWSVAAPFTCAFITCLVKGSASDITAQKLVERKEHINWKRTAAFGFFSGAYLGCGQHIWYNMIFTRWFGAAQTTKATVQKVVADSTIHTPMCYLPLYFGFENWVLGGQASTSASKTGASDHSTEEDGANNAPRDVSFTTEAAVAGLKKYFGPEGWKTCTTYWQMWPLFHAINFHFTPPPMRIACIAGFSYLWLIVLSFLTHQDLDAREDGDHAKKGGCAAEEEK